MRATGALMVGLLTALVLPCGAWGVGLPPGVHIDPGSPAAKEYALPLSQARNTGHSANESASSPPLFGAGIGNASSHRSTVAAKGTGPDARGESRRLSREGSSSNRGALASLDASHLDVAAHEGSGDGAPLALLGGGIAVLLLGGIGGVAMRRARRSTPPV